MKSLDKQISIREERIGASNAFGGKICDLLKQSKGGCLVNKSRSFSQTCNCQMNMSLTILMSLPDTVIIFHGPVGCGNSGHGSETYFRSGLVSRGAVPKPFIWASTNLDENDIINGGEKKLEEAIKRMDSLHRPTLIAVVMTCSPGIIGDNADELVSRLQKSTAAKVMLLHCEGFKTKIAATAYDVVYHGIARTLELEKEKGFQLSEEEQLRQQNEKSRTVNIFNVFSIGRTDELELQRLLNALGLKVNFFPNFAHPDSFKEISNASLNVSICPTHDDYFLELLKERFGTPYILKNMPIGIRNTNDWIFDVAEVFGLKDQARLLIESETEALEKGLKQYKEALRGKKVLVSGGEVRVVVTAMLMKELGCEVVGVRGHHYDKFGDPLYEKLLEDIPDADVNIATTQVFELANMLERTKPDLYLGHGGSGVWAGKLGIPSVPVFSQSQYYFGYKGAFEVARRANKVLQNKALQKNLRQNLKQPYKKEWYQKSPFEYIKDNEL
jgi:nitrogenase molybdenum-iron protein alpha chain